MKYFIGKKFNSKIFQNKKDKLEQILLSMGIEKEE
jgi:hypothetical protein